MSEFKGFEGFIHPKTHDGVYFAPIPFISGLIEGRGRYRDPNTGMHHNVYNLVIIQDVSSKILNTRLCRIHTKKIQ